MVPGAISGGRQLSRKGESVRYWEWRVALTEAKAIRGSEGDVFPLEGAYLALRRRAPF